MSTIKIENGARIAYHDNGDVVFEGLIDETVKNYVIPNGVTAINPYAFSGCKKLKSVVVPGNIEFIAPYAFSCCTHLKHVTLEIGVKFISEYAFEKCVRLTNIVFPSTLQFINDFAFSGCKKLKVSMPKDVLIERKAFCGCSAI